MRPEFEVHMLNESGKEKSRSIAMAFDILLNNLENDMKEGRYLSIVKSKLEEACFYAKKSMASRKENQV